MAKVKIITPDEVYGEGSWRNILGEKARKTFKTHMLGKGSVEDKAVGVFLPSFDLRLDTEDKAFQMSTAPCWQDIADPRLPRHFLPNGWFFPILMYPFMPAGDSKEHWVSPANRRNMLGGDELDPTQLHDAFDDLRRSISKNKTLSEGDKAFFLKTKRFTDDPLIPGRTSRNASLVEMKDKEHDWHLSVLFYTNGAHAYILNQARWIRSSKDGPARDPDYPDYLLGDFTRSDAALVWHPDKVLVDPKDQEETNVVAFTQRREILDPKQETRAISGPALAQRFLLQDPANWNIPTYDEQVHHMLEFYAPEVTAEMIREACGHRCGFDIPERKKSKFVSSGGSSGTAEHSDYSRSENEDPMSAVTGRNRLAPTPGDRPPIDRPAERELPPAVTGTERAPAASSEMYISGDPKDQANTKKKRSVAELQKLLEAGQVQYKVYVDGVWKLLAECGLVSLPKEDDDMGIPDDDDMGIPDDDAPAMGGGDPRDVVKKRLFPNDADFDKLSSELQKEAWSIIEEAVKHTDGGKDMTALPAELVTRFIALVPR